ncbi:alpha/beta hydrolase [uncultured Sphingomonas sp.]|uniref:alpha/beta hydrolase n=1 Tax=uncultured Sphingomonas sp. TaxID=158754 RepID=UPI0035CBCC6C
MTEETVNGEEPIADPRPSTEMAVNAARVDFTSAINGKQYRLFISEPVGEPPAAGWPVVYLIDGNLHFGIAVDTARIQARWPDTVDCVVVGIGYQTDNVGTALTVRNHDLTPPTPVAVTGSGWQQAMGATPADYGGMDDYLRMVEAEVKPRVAERVRVDPGDQTLMGHSLGGLTTLAALFRTPAAFNQYVAISPSIWVNGRWVLGFVDAFAERVRAGEVSARLLLSTGEWEEADPPRPPLPAAGIRNMTREVYAAMTADCRMVGNPTELAERLAPLCEHGLDLQFVVHPDEDHRSVVPAGIARGICYSMYRP